MTAQMLLFDGFYEKGRHLNAVEHKHTHTHTDTHTHTHTHIKKMLLKHFLYLGYLHL